MASFRNPYRLSALLFGASLVIGSVFSTTIAAQEEPEAVHGIAMHGDAMYPPDFEHFDYVNPQAPKGGTLRMAVVANGYDSFNPFVIRGIAAADVSTYVYDTLLVASDDEPFSAYGLIAESLETPEDRSYVIYNLREEARFQDGEPITADDVAFSFNLLTSEGHPMFRSYYADVSRATVIDEHRIRFDFGETNNRELPLILGQLPIFPKHYWQDRDFTKSGLTRPVGSGPYRIGEFEAGRSVTYERVKDYWAADLPVRKGRYNFDAIRYEYYSDDTVALESFKANNYDFRLESSAKNWATAYEGEQFRDGRAIKEAIEHQRPVGMQAFIFNTRKAKFQDPLVRRAMAYAFDFDWANRNLFYGQYRRTDSYFENSQLGSSGLPEGEELAMLERFRERLPEAVFTKPYTVPSTGGDNSLRDNLREGLRLFREAGYTITDGKLVHTETGVPLKFEILLAQKSFERIVLPFTGNLEKLGVEVDVRLIDTNQYIQRVRSFDFDMVTQVIPQSDSPGNEQRDFWHSENVDVKGSRNYMGVSDPVVDELVALLIQSEDREELVHRTRALDRVLLHSHYVIPHWFLDVDRIAYWSKLVRPEAVPKNGTDLSNWWAKP
jgi:microcin C transport system substrate-binding protein